MPIKPTEEGQKLRLEHLKALRERKANIQSLAQLKGTDGWLQYKKVIEDFIKIEKRRCEGIIRDAGRHFDSQDRPVFAEHTASDLNASIAIRDTYEMALSLVEYSEEKAEMIEREIKKYESAYKEANEVLS